MSVCSAGAGRRQASFEDLVVVDRARQERARRAAEVEHFDVLPNGDAVLVVSRADGAAQRLDHAAGKRGGHRDRFVRRAESRLDRLPWIEIGDADRTRYRNRRKQVRVVDQRRIRRAGRRELEVAKLAAHAHLRHSRRGSRRPRARSPRIRRRPTRSGASEVGDLHRGASRMVMVSVPSAGISCSAIASRPSVSISRLHRRRGRRPASRNCPSETHSSHLL